MGLMVGLGIGVGGATAGREAGVSPSASVSALPYTPAIFDSGASRGANAANIPLKGTTDGTNGTLIEARIVRADTGAEVHPWATIASASGGSWSGTYPLVPRNSTRLRAEIRVVGGSTIVPCPSDIMVGHVVMIIGQSEDDRMFKDGFDDRAYQTIPSFSGPSAEDSVFVLRSDPKNGQLYTTNGVERVSSSTPVTASLAHFANVFTRNLPDEKLLFIDATVSGTSRQDLAEDPTTLSNDRDWTTSFYDALTVIRDWGTDVGVVVDTWTAADSLSGDKFREKFAPFYTGMEVDGATYVLNTLSAGPDAGTWPRVLWDLSPLKRSGPDIAFDPAITKLAFHGPHRFEDNVAGTLRDTKEDTRLSIRNMIEDPIFAPIIRPKGPEILLYRNGERSNAPGSLQYDPAGAYWLDYAHPSAYTDDGLPARARHTAVAVMYALGRGPSAAVAHQVPKFNRAYWEPSGAYVELWYEAADGSTPAITTTRQARGEAAIPDSYAHRTEVAGFYINTTPAESATIVSGRVRILPISGAFTGYDQIRYGVGGASGIVQFPEDEFDEIWKNLPIIDMGIAGIDGIAVEPMPDADAIASTLVTAQTFTTSSAGPWFVDTANFTSNAGRATFSVRMNVSDASTTFSFLSQAGGGLKVEVLGSTSTYRISLEDNASVDLLKNHLTALSFPEGVWVDLVIAIDIPAQRLRIWQNGVLEEIPLLASATGLMEDTRKLNLLAGGASGVSQAVGSFEYLRVWKGIATTDATEPGSTPYWELIGDAAAVNALPSKKGSNAS